MKQHNDFAMIKKWVQPGSHILDLACGDGLLLHELGRDVGVTGYGLEINPQDIEACIQRGVNVIEHDLDKGLGNFRDASFDTVIMTQALQVMHFPHLVLDEMLRVGRECIITFPNFGHWRCRLHLAMHGRMPVSKFMPYTWFDTPNIHFCTFDDFEELCLQRQFRILDRMVVDPCHREDWKMRLWPNLMGEIAVYHLTKGDNND